VAFDPTGRRLASGSGDRTVRVWDAATGAEVACLRGHEGRVASVAFDPAGRRLASSSRDRTVRVWDAATGAAVACLRGHWSPVASVAFDLTGRRLASGSYDNTVRVWDAATGAEIACLRGHEREVMSVAFDPTGRRLASGADDGTRLWDVESWECLEVLSRTDEDYATAEQAARAFAWHALTHGLETVIKPEGGGETIAWFSPALNYISTHPSACIWAGAAGSHLYLIRLEGIQDRRSP
jgi:WD40 repeat protein